MSPHTQLSRDLPPGFDDNVLLNNYDQLLELENQNTDTVQREKDKNAGGLILDELFLL